MLRTMGVLACFLLTACAQAQSPKAKLPPGVQVEEEVAAGASKIVLIAGSNVFKPGEHEYLNGCAVLMDLLRQTSGTGAVLALDWPTKPETFRNAKTIVFYFDGGPKHGILKGDRLQEMQKLMEAGVGLVQLHQANDYPKDIGARVREWTGGSWESPGQRAHWVESFSTFPDHPVFRGVKPFTIDDGWLWKNTFVPGKKGVTPLLRTVRPKSSDDLKADSAIIAWAYERPAGGRTVAFTGGHLHKSLEQEGYRRFLTNAILWTANMEIPPEGSPVTLK